MEPERKSAATSESNDAGLPLDSVFKIKKLRIVKKAKASDLEAREEEAEGEDWGHTLASFRKKCKTPRRPNDGEESKSSMKKYERKWCLGMLDGSRRCLDVNMDDSLSGFLKRVQSCSVRKASSVLKKRKAKECDPSMGDGLWPLVKSPVLLDSGFSLHSESEKVYRKDIKPGGCPDKEDSECVDEFEDNLASPLVGRSVSLEGGLSSTIDGTQNQRGRKSRGHPPKEVKDVGSRVKRQEMLASLPLGSAGSLEGGFGLSLDGTQEDLVASQRGRKPRACPPKEVKEVGGRIDEDLNRVSEQCRKTGSYSAQKRRLQLRSLLLVRQKLK